MEFRGVWPLRPIPSPILYLFRELISLTCLVPHFCWGWLWTQDPPASTSWTTGITDVCHCARPWIGYFYFTLNILYRWWCPLQTTETILILSYCLRHAFQMFFASLHWLDLHVSFIYVVISLSAQSCSNYSLIIVYIAIELLGHFLSNIEPGTVV